MSCTVAISNSLVFSPSRVRSSPFCKSSLPSSPDKNLTLTQTHSPSSSLPFRLRLQKPPSRLNRASIDCAVSTSSSSSSPPALLKRKRPARLDIPNSGMGFGGGCVATSVVGVVRREVVEAESDGYSWFCKRGRREAWKIGTRPSSIFKEIPNSDVLMPLNPSLETEKPIA